MHSGGSPRPHNELHTDGLTSDSEHQASCVVCDASTLDYLFNKGTVEYWECPACTVRMQVPLPDAETLREYYDASYEEGVYGTLFAANESLKETTAARRFRSVARRAPAGPWLDIGASTGVFVQCCIANGVDARGIEISDIAAGAARDRGIPVETCAVEDYEPIEPFAAITAFDIIEHVTSPADMVERAHKWLAPGGRLLIATPDTTSPLSRLMGRRWTMYIPEEHVVLFNEKSLTHLLESRGFRVVEKRAFRKPITFSYGVRHLELYNPQLARLGGLAERALPSRLSDAVLPMPLGEMLVVAEKTDAA